MFDIGWTELLVIGVVALIVVGPKDLPGMFRTLGRFTAKAKSMARDFSRAMEDAADEAGIRDVAKDLKDATSARKLGLDKIQDAASSFEKWDPLNKTSSSKKKGSGAKKGPATQALSEERAEMARKINEAGAWKATERKAAEAAREAGAEKSTAKKAKAKKPAAKKPAVKKATAKTAKKTATTKTATSKTVARKPAATKAAAKTAAKAPKAAAKKPASKAAAPKAAAKPAAKTAAKPAAKKAAKRKPATKGVSE